MKMKNKTYDKLKDTVTIFLPAGITLFVALSDIWNIPHSAEIAATLTAVTAFMGTMLKSASADYRSEKEKK